MAFLGRCARSSKTVTEASISEAMRRVPRHVREDTTKPASVGAKATCVWVQDFLDL